MLRAAAGGRPDQGSILDSYGTDFYYRHWDLVGLVNREGWIAIYRGPDGEVWLRDLPRNRANLARCAAYYAERGIPFSRQTGLDVPAAPR